jgi:hypothetical protein
MLQRPESPAIDTLQEMYNEYMTKISLLDADVARARRAIIASAEPESLEPTTLVLQPGDKKGLSHIKQVIAQLGEEESPGRFGDEKLEETVKGWKTIAEKRFGGKPKDYVQKLIDLLNQRATAVLASRNAIRTTYAGLGGTYRECQKVGAGTTTLSLAIQAKDTAQFGKARDTGTPIIVTARSEYQRELLEVLPIGFLTFPSHKTGFGIENGLVAENVKYANDVAFRAGLMLASSPFRFGEINEFAMGFGIGTGLVGDSKPALSEFLVGALGSWRDWLRVGLGYGFSQTPKALKNGATLGSALPLSTENKKLDDFIDTEAARSFFLLFTISGLKLAK